MAGCPALLNVVFNAFPSLACLLSVFWVLASGSVIVTLLPVPLPQAFKSAVRVSAARGKLWSGRPKGLGRFGAVSVPQKWFAHFYAVGTVASLATAAALLLAGSSLLPTARWESNAAPGSVRSHFAARMTRTILRDYLLQGLAAARGAVGGAPSWWRGAPPSTSSAAGHVAAAGALLVPLALFFIHCVRRYVESVWVMHYPEGSRMHLLAYLFGIAYYVVVPLSLLPRGFFQASVLQKVAAATCFAFEKARGAAAGVTAEASCCSQLFADVSTDQIAWIRNQSAEGHEGDSRTNSSFVLTSGMAILATGVAVFLIGSVVQLSAHVQLGRLARATAAARRRLASAAAESRKQEDCTGVASSASAGELRQRKANRTTVEVEKVTAADDASSAASAGEVVVVEGVAYGIPHGGFFRWVSCPHYSGEVIIYLGLALATAAAERLAAAGTAAPSFFGGFATNPRPWLALVWVLVNLILAAEATQRWYRSAFGDRYPKRRRALVPFIF